MFEEDGMKTLEHRQMLTVVRTGKPLGYTWRLWHDPRGPKKWVAPKPKRRTDIDVPA